MPDHATLGAIHIAAKDRGLDEDTYRDLLQRVAGVRSARDLNDDGARLIMAEFERLGFKRPTRRGTAADRRPVVKKARALWTSLYWLDEVGKRTDKALDTFAKRITGKDILLFATNGEAAKVVQGLKAMLLRAGVSIDSQQAVVEEQFRRLRRYRETLASNEALDELLAQPINGSDRRLMITAGRYLRRLKLGHRHRR